MQQGEAFSVIHRGTLDLIEAQIGVLGRMPAGTGPAPPRNDGSHGTGFGLDPAGIEAWRRALVNEKTKVERVEMVLAVVGTMKAGKSTTINALVGAEVLPNRNQPMTTLPTLIRHSPTALSPVLQVPKPEPILAFAKLVRTRLIAVHGQNRIGELILHGEPDGRDLIEQLLRGDSGFPVATRHEGQAPIFAFLKQLNDLFRLAQDPLIDLSPPYDAFEDVVELPVIEFAFHPLRGIDGGTMGSLALLDTPGPNESGQSARLRRILRTQLAKASAVLAVLDYTQLKSEAEAEIRQELEEIADQTEDRLFVLVNKFDQKDRHGLDADALRQHVSRGLMGNRTDPQRVFPVSSRNAFLAWRAREEFTRNSRLPDANQEPWVGDFGRLAFGVTWQRDLRDSLKVRTAIRELWLGSKFEEPVRAVVLSGAARAAFVSTGAALAKLDDGGRRVEAALVLRRGALGQGLEQLRSLVAGLEQDIANIDSAQGEARAEVFRVVGHYVDVLEQLQSVLRRVSRAALERYFRSGQVDGPQLIAEIVAGLQEIRDQPRDAFQGFQTALGTLLTDLGERLPPVPAAPLFDPSVPILRCETESLAKAKAGQIAELATLVAQFVARLLHRKTAEISTLLEHGVRDVLKSRVGRILALAQERLTTQGFALEIALPDPRLEGIALAFEEVSAAGITHQTLIRKTRRETHSVLGSLGRWWKGSDSRWGFETATYHEVQHQVNIDRMREAALKGLDLGEGDRRSLQRDYFTRVLEPRLLEYFRDLKQYLEGLQGELRRGIEDRRREHRTVTELVRTLGILADESARQVQKVAELRAAMQALPGPDPGASGALPLFFEPGAPEGVGRRSPAPLPPVDFDSEATMSEMTLVGDATLAGGLLQHFHPTLEVTYGGQSVVVDAVNTPLSIGRGGDCGLIVGGRRASRRHAELRYENGVFFLSDSSTNGTFVHFESGERRAINRNSEKLKGQGQIGLGTEPGKDPEHTVHFKCRTNSDF